MLLEAVRYFEQRGKLISANPGTYFVILALGFLGGLAWQGQEVATAGKIAEGYRADVERLQKKLDGIATLKERMDVIDRAFSEDKVKRLESELGIVPPGEVEIVEPPDSKGEGVEQIVRAFSASGWKVVTTSTPRDWDFVSNSGNILAGVEFAAGQPVIVLNVTDNAMGKSMTTAFDAAGIPYIKQTTAAGDPQIPQVWVISSSDAPDWSNALPRAP